MLDGVDYTIFAYPISRLGHIKGIEFYINACDGVHSSMHISRFQSLCMHRPLLLPTT